ncbi:MAG: hypothetical protein A3F90_08045 [Deltaproteobacteria bacterium RIFCSPLOWO2_12_FULL_60_19]|nr:MAG: hypothetical protein A3F90_08045 [Deltaproteobacteria bacterium RIFCSPLOWO2_12_FULL_60_19]
MGRAICVWAFLVFPLSLFGAGHRPAWAAESGVKIGLFDLQKIMAELNPEVPAGRSGRQAAAQKSDPAAREAQKLRNEIQKLRKELAKEDLTEERRKELTEERNRRRERLQVINEKAREADKTPSGVTEDEIRAAVARYGQEQGFALLFEKNYWSDGDAKNAVIFPGKVVDISLQIVRRMKAEAQRGTAKQGPEKKDATTKAPSTKP